MIFLLRSRHLGSPVQSSLEPCCTAGTTPSCAGAARFNVRRRAAAMWHRSIGWFVRLPQSPRGREARTLSNKMQAAHLRRLYQPPTGRVVPVHGSWHDGAKGKTRTLGVPAAAPLRPRASPWRIGVGVHRRGQPLQAVADDGRVREQPGLHACCNVENKLGLGHLALWRLLYSATACLRLAGAGWPELRPASANQPCGPGNIARPGLSSTQAPHVRPHLRHVREAACARAAARVRRHRRGRARRGRRHRHHGAPRAED